MEHFGLCLNVAKKEMQKFNLDPGTLIQFVTELTATSDVNFVAYNRVAYMYKHATSNIYFIKDCISRFLTEYPGIDDLISSWKSSLDSNLCSMSCGPALDYLAFMSAFLENESLSRPTFNSVKILSPCGAWRNTVGLVMDAIHETGLGTYTSAQLNYENVEVIQGDLFRSLPDKCLERLGKANVVLMMRTLNLAALADAQESSILKKLIELIFILKPDTTIFCIDTKPSVAIFEKALSKFPSKFLYQTTHFSERLPGTFPEAYKDEYGCLPVVSASGSFFVCQKLSSYPLMPNCLITPLRERSESTSATNSSKVPDESLLHRQFSAGNDSIEEKKKADITETIKNLVFLSTEPLSPNSAKDSPNPPSNSSVALKNSHCLTPSQGYTEEELELYHSMTSTLLSLPLQIVEKSGLTREENIPSDFESSYTYDLWPPISSNSKSITCNSPILKNDSKQELSVQQNNPFTPCYSSVLKSFSVDQGSVSLSDKHSTPRNSAFVNATVDQRSIGMSSMLSMPCESSAVNTVDQKSFSLPSKPSAQSNSSIARNVLNQGLLDQQIKPATPVNSSPTKNIPGHIFLNQQLPPKDNIWSNPQKIEYRQTAAVSESTKMKVGKNGEGSIKPNNPPVATKSIQIQTDPITGKKPHENHHRSQHAHDSQMPNCASNYRTCCCVVPSCSASQFCDNSCSCLRVNSSICYRAQCQRESVFSHCKNAQIRCCCTCRRNCNMACGCSSHSHQCFHEHPSRCYVEPCRGQPNSVRPNIVIPLQDISDDILSQFILALKSSSKSNQ